MFHFCHVLLEAKPKRYKSLSSDFMILLSCVLNELNEKGSFLKLEQEKSNWTRKRIIISFGLQITL